MCKVGNFERVFVKIAASHAAKGKDTWRQKGIDKCIAPLVNALQLGGVDMYGSCCGHESRLGIIHLRDGRILLVTDGDEWMRSRSSRIKFYFGLLLKEIWRWIKLEIESPGERIKWRRSH